MHNGAMNFLGIMLLLFWALLRNESNVIGLSNVYNMYLISSSYIKCVVRTNNLLVVYLRHGLDVGWHLPSRSVGSHVWCLGIYGRE